MPPGTSEQPATHLVVGITVRPLAASAHKAGLKVCAIDLYNDLDTQSSSHQSLAVGFDGMGLDSEGLFDSIQKLDPSRSLRVVYAGGFEHAPSQIEKIEERPDSPRQLSRYSFKTAQYSRIFVNNVGA